VGKRPSCQGNIYPPKDTHPTNYKGLFKGCKAELEGWKFIQTLIFKYHKISRYLNHI